MPDWGKEVRKRLARLQLDHEAEIVEELGQHLEDVYQRSLRAGATEAEAKNAALQELATDDLLQKEMRRSQIPFKESPVAGGPTNSNFVADLMHDLRYAARLQRKNPGFTVVAVIALALGIGANTAIFSVVNTILLRPLPYKDPEQLVMVWEDATKQGYPRDTPAAANFVDWRDQNQVFEGMAAIYDTSFNLTGSGDPERLEGRSVSANMFSLLGVEPQIGRVFTAAEDQPGAQRVVLLSYALWQRRFGGDQKIVGQSLTLNGESYVVVGVMPARFQFPSSLSQTSRRWKRFLPAQLHDSGSACCCLQSSRLWHWYWRELGSTV
jgi:putative ABC transport system permease protein